MREIQSLGGGRRKFESEGAEEQEGNQVMLLEGNNAKHTLCIALTKV